MIWISFIDLNNQVIKVTNSPPLYNTKIKWTMIIPSKL